MCFYIQADHKVNKNEKIAKKNIVCYKHMSIGKKGGLKSPYQDARYKLNKVYKLKKEFEILHFDQIHEGYHAHSTKKKAQGYVGYSNGLVECIIPKESLYYYNAKRKEYVSTSIRANKIIVPSYWYKGVFNRKLKAA